MHHHPLAVIYEISLTVFLGVVGAVSYNSTKDVIVASFWVAFYAGIAWGTKEVLSYLKPYFLKLFKRKNEKSN